MRRVLVPIVVAAMSPFAAVPPAVASGEVSINFPHTVLYDSCEDYDFTYSVSLPAGYGDDWSMELQLIGPDGNEASSSYVYGESRTGVEDFFICESPNLPGTYRIRGAGEACDSDYDCVPISATEVAVSMRLPRTKTTLKASVTDARPGQVVRFKIQSLDERPAGYFGTSSTSVVLQVYSRGRWKKVTTGYTNGQGVAVVRARYTGGRKRLRAVTAGTEDRTGSTSRVVKTR